MKRLRRQANLTSKDISEKDVVQAFMLDLKTNYNAYSFVEEEDLVYTLTRMEDDYRASVELAKFYVENVKADNFIKALSEIKNEPVEIDPSEVSSIVRAVKRFYNFTNEMPYEIVKSDVEEAEDMISNSVDDE